MEISIQIANIGPRDLGTLSKVFGILQGSGIEVTTTSGPVARASAPAEPEAAAPAKKTRAPRAAKQVEKPKAPKAEKAPKAPKAPKAAAAEATSSAEDTYSRYTRNNPNLFTAADRKLWDPALDEAHSAYLAAAGSRAQGGRTIKNWSINRLRAETAALGGAPADAEGSPSPGKRARGRPPGGGKKGKRATKRKK